MIEYGKRKKTTNKSIKNDKEKNEKVKKTNIETNENKDKKDNEEKTNDKVSISIDSKKFKIDKGSLVGIVGIFVIIVTIIFVVIIGNNRKEKYLNFEQDIINVASSYYKDHYYEQFDEPAKQLVNFSETGISISFDILINYKKFSDETYRVLDNSKCNYKDSKVIIYPEGHYKKNDFNVKVELKCEKEIEY